MRILHLAPLWFPVAQDSLGGVETFLTHLTRALEELGCCTTLIATGDSQTAAELVPVVPLNLCAQMGGWDCRGVCVYYQQQQLLVALQRASEFDVVHSHVGWGGYVLSGALSRPPALHTQHSPVYGDQQWFVFEHPASRSLARRRSGGLTTTPSCSSTFAHSSAGSWKTTA